MSGYGLVIQTPGFQGPPGPTGPTGPQGQQGSAASFIFQFQQAATVVHVPHMLGLYPSVTVISSAGDILVTDLAYVDINNLTVTLSAADTGTIYCN